MGKFLAACIAALAIIGLFFGWHMEYGTQRTLTFRIASLDDQSQGSSGHKYLVFTRRGNVLENTDAFLHGKTDSSNIQARFQPGQIWQCQTYGMRIFIMSSYRDILDGCKLMPAGTPTDY